MEKLKILHIAPIPSSRASGFYFSILGLAKGQAKLGHCVAVVCSEPPGISKDDVPCEVLFFDSPLKRNRNPLKHDISWFENILKKFGKPDIVNFHGTYIPMQIALAKHLKNISIPYIHTPRGDLKLFPQRIKWVKKKLANFLFVNDFLKFSNAIHALTSSEKEEILKKFHFLKDKIFIVSNGIDSELQKFAINKLPLKRKFDTLTLTFVGRIDFYIKGLDLLFNALKLLENENLNFIFNIVGPFYTPKDEKLFYKTLATLKKPENIFYHGSLFGTKKQEIIFQGDIFVCTSRSEGMPMSVLEAMALGKPCVVTPGSNAKPYILESNSGWYCEETPESIAKILKDIIFYDNASLNNLGENAKKYVLENFLWENVAHKNIEEIRHFV